MLLTTWQYGLPSFLLLSQPALGKQVPPILQTHYSSSGAGAWGGPCRTAALIKGRAFWAQISVLALTLCRTLRKSLNVFQSLRPFMHNGYKRHLLHRITVEVTIQYTYVSSVSVFLIIIIILRFFSIKTMYKMGWSILFSCRAAGAILWKAISQTSGETL